FALQHQADVERALVFDLTIDVLILAELLHDGFEGFFLRAGRDAKGFLRAAAARKNECRGSKTEQSGASGAHYCGDCARAVFSACVWRSISCSIWTRFCRPSDCTRSTP